MRPAWSATFAGGSGATYAAKNFIDELGGVKDRFAPRHCKIDEMNSAPRLNCGALPAEGHKARANAKTRAPLARAWPRTSRKAA
jgi:hypothetical protein